jgi:hypothetical protein
VLARLRALTFGILARTPLSLLGLGALLGSLLVFRLYAWPREDYVVRVAMAAVALAVVQSSLAVSWAAWRARRWLQGRTPPTEALRMQAERGRSTGLRMPRFGYWLGVRIDAEWSDDRVRAEWQDQDGWRTEMLRARRRGRWSEVDRDFSVESVFGLARVTFRHRESRAVEVAPWSGPAFELPDLQAVTTGEAVSHPRGMRSGDRVDMRPYAAGDPPRWLLWKVYARTGELMVRTPEAAGDPRVRWALYLINAGEDEAAAGVAAELIHRRRLGAEWAFGCDAAPGPIESRDEALRAIEASARSDEAPGSGLPRFVSCAGDARLIVLAPPAPGPWLAPARGALRNRNAVIWVVSDGAAGPRSRWLYEPTDSPLVLGQADDQRQLQRALTGRPMAFLDRRTGRRAA